MFLSVFNREYFKSVSGLCLFFACHVLSVGFLQLSLFSLRHASLFAFQNVRFLAYPLDSSLSLSALRGFDRLCLLHISQLGVEDPIPESACNTESVFEISKVML